MKTVPDTQVYYSMSKENEAVLHVALDEVFQLETKDCYSNKLKTEKCLFTQAMWDTVNPATGPVFIEGAHPGDIIKIEILEITTRDFAVMGLEHGSGALGEFIEGQETSIYPIRNGKMIFNEQISIAVKPMIGVIGVAPAGEAILNGTPGEHGSNMDCKEIGAGSILYLPVNVEGALLAAGDLHAVMGDGEVCICGAEVAGKITLKVSIAKKVLPTPCLETEDFIYFIASALTLDECEKIVLKKAHNYLTDTVSMTANDAAKIMSLAGELQVCQVVDPLKTMRFAIPKYIC